MSGIKDLFLNAKTTALLATGSVFFSKVRWFLAVADREILEK
ncbi:hypothetical protein [Aggregatibacter actinomycetemcomitans]|nr:hypothetical protein [Aggregatibacter actinomycetemcomitans]